jgi:hypothetical protein
LEPVGAQREAAVSGERHTVGLPVQLHT